MHALENKTDSANVVGDMLKLTHLVQMALQTTFLTLFLVAPPPLRGSKLSAAQVVEVSVSQELRVHICFPLFRDGTCDDSRQRAATVPRQHIATAVPRRACRDRTPLCAIDTLPHAARIYPNGRSVPRPQKAAELIPTPPSRGITIRR